LGRQLLFDETNTTDVYVLDKYASFAKDDPSKNSFDSITTLVRELWTQYEGFVFICASGIAVRAIAPLVSSKHTDPAVVVCPDNGAFAISLLSGHEGGANDLAKQVAAWQDCLPIITTATECSPKVMPRNIVAGIGFRKNISSKEILAAISSVFDKNNVSPLRLRKLCSIDLKEGDEELEFAADYLGVELEFFSAQELTALSRLMAPEGGFSASDFVKKTTGVDNVCERAVLAGCRTRGKLIARKTVCGHVTIAIAEQTL
jgi:cobalt-precorrin 5A hydrolase